MPIWQGEVYRHLPTENHGPILENEYKHRALIVSSDEYNQGNHIVIILFTSKKKHLPQRPSWVRFSADEQFGLDVDCVAQAESLTRAPPRYLGERLGRISNEKLGGVVEAIGYVMNASCYLSYE